MAQAPNILLIRSLDTGRYVQPYGYSVPAPNIQRLAEQGVLFRQAFCAAQTCSPSQASMMTGQWAHTCGMFGPVDRGFSMDGYDRHIVHTLRAAGYQSVLVGPQQIAQDPGALGYDQVVPVESGHVEHVAPAAVAFLKQAHQKPFFLSVGFLETGRGFRQPSANKENPRYCLPPHPLPDVPQIREEMVAFKASARLLDLGVGAILQILEAGGLVRNTLVICTTDHGIAFPGMECTLSDQGMGVMLVVRGPAGFSGGRVCDAMVSHVDLFPTICDWLGNELPAWLQGRSMMPWVRGEAERINDEIYSEINYHRAYEPRRAVRTTRWKYVRRFDDRQGLVLPNTEDSPSKNVWLEHKWWEHNPGREQLYDLVFDPNEAHNVAGDPEKAPILAEMRERLGVWMETSDDPLLQGPVVAPSGARVNNPDGLSSNEPAQIVP